MLYTKTKKTPQLLVARDNEKTDILNFKKGSHI